MAVGRPNGSADFLIRIAASGESSVLAVVGPNQARSYARKNARNVRGVTDFAI